LIEILNIKENGNTISGMAKEYVIWELPNMKENFKMGKDME
jgi:hypothetical protein